MFRGSLVAKGLFCDVGVIGRLVCGMFVGDTIRYPEPDVAASAFELVCKSKSA